MTPQPRRSASVRAWTTVVLLSLLYVASFVDRIIPAMIATDLQRDLVMSPVQFGLLVGTGFGLLYAAIGLPIAQLAEQRHRKRVIVIGVLLWTAATLSSAAAQSFGQILVARAGLAIGEAVLIPTAISLIGDLFEGRARTRATAIFIITGQVTGSGLFLLGALAIATATLLAPVAGVASWRLTFVLVGLPPLLLAIGIMILVREPARRGSVAADVAGPRAGVRYLAQRWTLFLPLLVAIGLMNAIAFGLLSWFPTILAKDHAIVPAQAAFLMGIVGVPASLLGASASPLLTERAHRRGLRAGAIWVMIGFAAIAITAIAVLISAGSTPVAMAGFGIGVFGLAGMNVVPIIIIQWVAPPQMRARLTALNQLGVSILGLSMGPPAVALIAAHVLGAAQALAPALALFDAAVGLAVIALLAISAKGFATEMLVADGAA